MEKVEAKTNQMCSFIQLLTQYKKKKIIQKPLCPGSTFVNAFNCRPEEEGVGNASQLDCFTSSRAPVETEKGSKRGLCLRQRQS